MSAIPTHVSFDANATTLSFQRDARWHVWSAYRDVFQNRV